nr:hypothetical protein [uncultured Lichenicoccus sp.]
MLCGALPLSSGDVVAGGGSVFIVQLLTDNDRILLRLENRGAACHRADVVPEHWSELASSGLPVQDIVVRCVPVWSVGTCQLTRLGHVSEMLRDKIMVALKREMLVRRFEDGPPMRSNLTASTSSSGRRVNVVRYA